MMPEFNTPLAVYPASEHCTATHGLYSQCLGRMAHVFIGAAHGWQGSRQTPPSVEDVAMHWNEICDTKGDFDVPPGATHEHAIVLRPEEHRAGKAGVSTCSSWWSPNQYKKKKVKQSEK